MVLPILFFGDFDEEGRFLFENKDLVLNEHVPEKFEFSAVLQLAQIGPSLVGCETYVRHC